MLGPGAQGSKYQAMESAVRLVGSKISWRPSQRQLLQLVIATGGLLITVWLYLNILPASSSSSSSSSSSLSSPSIMDLATQTRNQSQCIDFDPAPIAEKLNSAIKLEKNTYNNADISEFVCSIMHHDMNLTAKLDCAASIDSRYNHLRPSPSASPQIQYYFALDLYQAMHIILPLMGTIIETMRFLGPEYCALSIVEGRSTDGTYAILAGLKAELNAMGVPYFLTRNSLDPKASGENRITALSHLRNQALQPLIEEGNNKQGILAPNPTILFINDVVLCPEDILELLHQRVRQSAIMTCAFDWNANGGSFYDSWVSRSMSGNLFFEVTHDSQHWLADDMFFDHPDSATRWGHSLPIQVYSCWGGMVTLDAQPFIQGKVKFRSSEKDECYMGEPMTLAKDLWGLGLGKVLTVPSVNVAYEYDRARDAKDKRGYVDKIVGHTQYSKDEEMVKWQKAPPPQVKCMPVFSRQWWTTPV
ncbi:hypothetical protein N7533_000422 [Penicillium manginii]|uniref:uncharacterized protein n=1 Tax=Penicillium manginii TaxID=203109 RepID=UPI00254923D0|nr:uncharacterized protein N7533_000422 [Penicillium manginii]KAJ5767839.1 hypothetical protein N7533_000422 [Penicillium manginii]